MEQAKVGDMVSVHYTGKLEDGTVFDSSEGRDPLQFEIGTSSVIPGFEHAVVGMAPGESKTANVPAEQGYGRRETAKVVEVERAQLPPDLNLRVGQRLKLTDQQENSTLVTVTEMSDAMVKLDANHPLAGQDLVFDIELVAIGG
jgi:FKBP-type peptidyl-prolyl cis-trans isomerase 2